jgi:adenosylcobinamide-GDP ribazoletransferase
MSWASAWRLAVGTLTVIPVRPPSVVNRRVAGRAMLLAPVAVLPLAVLAAVLGRLAALTGWPSLLSGVVVVAVLALGTRALHLDGLADTVDGLGSGRLRERALEIMRRGDVGPMGVVALVLVLGAEAVAAGVLTSSWTGAALLAVVIAVSRTSLLLACRVGVPAARPDGLGATVAGSVQPALAAVSGLLSALVLVGTVTIVGRPWWIGALAVIIGGTVAYAMVRLALRRLGGITGDVLGAVVELTLLALLLVVTL